MPPREEKHKEYEHPELDSLAYQYTAYHQYSIRDEVIERLSEKQKHILGFSAFGTLGGHDGSSVSPSDFDPNRESIGILKP